MGEDQALARLGDILARPEYQVDTSVPWWQQLLAPVLDLIWLLITRVFQTANDSAAGKEGILGWGVLAVCALLFVAVVVYLARAVRISVLRESRMAGASLAERRQRSDELWQAAQALATAGQFAEAVRMLYLSALYALDERALLHVEASLTNREHAQRLRQLHPEMAGTFADVVERYDHLRYGQAPIGGETFGELSQRVELVRTTAFRGAPA
jgi:hypothetical protein